MTARPRRRTFVRCSEQSDEGERMNISRKQLPILLSGAALTVALLGSTPVGRAVASTVPPFARHANTADFATNAGSVDGFRAASDPRPGRLLPLGRDGKFPASVGVA